LKIAYELGQLKCV